MMIHSATATTEEEETQPPKACRRSIGELLNGFFPSCGTDCRTYELLLTQDATFYHPHYGFYTKEDLLQKCYIHGVYFVPWLRIHAGSPLFGWNTYGYSLTSDGKQQRRAENSCLVLIPYCGYNTDTLEPVTGYLIMDITPAPVSRKAHWGYVIHMFVQFENIFSVPYNYANPNDITMYNRTLEVMANYGSSGGNNNNKECQVPIQPFITDYLNNYNTWTSGEIILQQQGDALLLAAGGLCQVLVPYLSSSSRDNNLLSTGLLWFQFIPNRNTGSYFLEEDYPYDFPQNNHRGYTGHMDPDKKRKEIMESAIDYYSSSAVVHTMHEQTTKNNRNDNRTHGEDNMWME